jgi:ribosomal protein S18 acetylase RimI-like enzyme
MNMNTCAGAVCRRVGVNRIDDLLALEEASFEYDRISRRNLRHLLCSPSACCLGVFLDGELVGSMIILFRRNTCLARIYSLAVAAALRGRGIARRLMTRAEREARARGCNRLRLEVRMDNIPAIKLYERLGFEGIEIIPAYYEDDTHAMVYRKGLE